MDDQKERAAFEAWCDANGLLMFPGLLRAWQARAALAAAPAPAAPWRPIETAPRDATCVLICKATDADGQAINGAAFGLFVQRAAWWEGENAWIVYNDAVLEAPVFFEPTHWMPLPAAPGAAAPAPAPLTDERVRDAYMSTNTRTHDQTFAAFRDGVRFAERAHGVGTAAAPAPHPDTADAERWRHVLRSVYLLRQGEYVLRPGRPSTGRDDSIGSQWLRRDVDAALDAARAQAQKGE